jgi:hypothetical protein
VRYSALPDGAQIRDTTGDPALIETCIAGSTPSSLSMLA